MADFSQQVLKNIDKAAEYLKNNEVIAFQTETVYGLGAIINSDEALLKIYSLKNRAQDNPLITHVCLKEQIYKIAKNINKTAEVLIHEFFPGPLTLVLEKQKHVSNILTAGLDTIAMRMPSNKIAQKLIEKTGIPVAAASANKSGRPSPTHWKHVVEDFQDEIPCILYDHENQFCDFGLESTVVLCTDEKKLIILRSGSTTKEDIEKILEKYKLNTEVNLNKDLEKTLCPGMKYRHYSPKAKVILFNPLAFLTAGTKNKAAVLYLSELQESFLEKFELKYKFTNNSEYAKNLYKLFRECDQKKIEEIHCEIPSISGLGLALRDRLFKAKSQC